MPADVASKRAKRNRFVGRRGMVPPSVFLMHVSDKDWEKFIERACWKRDKDGVKYAQVKLLGNARDKGRDVEARLQPDLVEDQWDLYQAKHYAGRLTPGDAFPELVKFFNHLQLKSFPRPRKYYICAPQNAGPDLHDYLANPEAFKAALLEAWENGNRGLAGNKIDLTPQLRSVVEGFDFSRFEECLVHDLLSWHERDKSDHYKLFGIEPERGDDPSVPASPQAREMNYIEELLRAYAENNGAAVRLEDMKAASPYSDHFASAREVFYCAEGLRLFSRDLYSEDEFAKLLEMVLKGVKPTWTSPRLKAGLERLDAVLGAVSGLGLTESKLYPRLRGGDLPGSCHHLANEKLLKWVR